MGHPSRYELLFGPYHLPVFKYGDVVMCERRGQGTLCGLSHGSIPWLVGKCDNHKALVLCGDLVEAVKREASLAIQYWWGVSYETVWRWRKSAGRRDGSGR